MSILKFDNVTPQERVQPKSYSTDPVIARLERAKNALKERGMYLLSPCEIDRSKRVVVPAMPWTDSNHTNVIFAFNKERVRLGIAPKIDDLLEVWR